MDKNLLLTLGFSLLITISFNEISAMHAGHSRKEDRQSHHVALKWAKKQACLPTSLEVTLQHHNTQILAIACIALLCMQPVQAQAMYCTYTGGRVDCSGSRINGEPEGYIPVTCKDINQYGQKLLAACGQNDACLKQIHKIIEDCKPH